MNVISKYILDNFSLYYDCDLSLISYNNKNSKINIVSDLPRGFFEGNYDLDPDKVIRKEWRGRQIPFLFDTSDQKEIISINNGQVTINYDIIASAFYFLSGWNEQFAPKDELGRVVYKESMIAKLDVADLPVVNYYFDILKTAVEKVAPISKKPLWGDREMAVVLTHDIDTCQTGWLEDSFYALRKGKLLTLPYLLFKRIFGKDVWFNLKEISTLEKEHDANSSFYFLPEKGRKGKEKNADYKVSAAKVKKVIIDLMRDGHDIGVHGSFGTQEREEEFKTGIDRIPVAEVKGNRFHYLMWNNEKSVIILEKAGIKYDSTLGFSEHIGFRRGTCYPFYLYDLKNNKMSSVLEIPMNIMDVTLNKSKYMGLKKDDVMPRIESLLAEVHKFNGVLTVLWHNNYFTDLKYSGWKTIYQNILKASIRQNAVLKDGYSIYETIVK